MNIVLFYKYMKKNIAPSSLPDTSRQLAHVKNSQHLPEYLWNPDVQGISAQVNVGQTFT